MAKNYTRPEADYLVKQAIDADAAKGVPPVDRLVAKLDLLNAADKAAKVADDGHRRRMEDEK